LRLRFAYLRIAAQQTAGRQPRAQYSQSPTSGSDVETTDRWRRESQELLAAGQQNPLGQSFTVAGRTFTRVDRPHALAGNICARDPDTGELVLLNRAEEHAFWACAVIEVLRHTGIRVGELLELTHRSLVQYRLASTGELVPLLQSASSKTDAERLLISPENADVVAIICRIRRPNRTVPFVKARDSHERIWMPPAPLLFQHPIGMTEVNMRSDP
jgi:hypothetical protein